MASIKGEVGAAVDLTAAALHSLASAALATMAEYDNSTNLYLFADFELFIDNTANPTAGNQFDMWFLMAIDGTNYSATDGPPPNLFVGSFIMQAVQDIRYNLTNVRLPLCKFKPYVRNNSGQSTGASGNTLKMIPGRYQSA
jgi:hypothetical protein